LINQQEEKHMATTRIDLTRKDATAKNAIAQASSGVIESLSLATIYTMFFKPFLFQFLEEIGKYFLFPIVAGGAVVHAVLAWRQAYIDGGKTRSVVSAVVETIAAVAIVIAVVGSLAATALFALAAPIIFTAVIAGKTLFNAGSAIYYGIKAASTKETELDKHGESKKDKYTALAKAKGMAAIAGVFATVAVVAAFLLAKVAAAAIAAAGIPVVIAGAGIGIAGAVIGGTLAVIHGYKSYKAAQAAKKQAAVIDNSKTAGNSLTSPALIQRRLNTTSPSRTSSPLITTEEESAVTMQSTNNTNDSQRGTLYDIFNSADQGIIDTNVTQPVVASTYSLH
jgi:hypothetical protein